MNARTALVWMGAAILVVWLLHYISDSDALSESIAGHLVYLLGLLLPSVVFWLALWTRERVGVDERMGRLLARAYLWASLIGVSAGVSVMAWGQLGGDDEHPLTSAVLSSAYACSWALLLASSTWRRAFRRWLATAGGRAALCASAALALGWWLQTRFGTSIDSRAEPLIGIALATWFVGALALCFLALLSPHWREVVFAVAGLAVLSGLLLRTYLLVGLLMSGIHFWPFVLMMTLVAESVVVRAVCPKVMLMTVPVHVS